ncbi:MAG: S8 family serine peptidase, partial [Desulfocapsa sp.]|nr:S8 family serine peptidase [Desulfocapsa sp.]
MLKKSLLLVTAIGLTLTNTALADKFEKIRESTVIYQINENATPAQLKRFNSLVHKNNIITKRELKGVGINIVKLKNIKGLEKTFSKQMMDTGAVKFAEPDVLVPHDEIIPNDFFYGEQWHHETINSPVAWEETQGNHSVNVCILDTGVDTNHPDLTANLVFPGFNAAYDSTTDDSADNNVEDAFGHGTGTAGTAGAVGNNGSGV